MVYKLGGAHTFLTFPTFPIKGPLCVLTLLPHLCQFLSVVEKLWAALIMQKPEVQKKHVREVGALESPCGQSTAGAKYSETIKEDAY